MPQTTLKAPFLTRLLAPDNTPRWGTLETITLLLYIALVATAIAHHTPWSDESQAWLLAKESTWRDLFLHRLHYEGTPGLWHALLKLLQLVHVSFTGMHWAAGAIAATAAALLLACSPFPLILRILLPFTFFLAYQDAVIARSYVLFAPLAFAAATLLRAPKPRPWLFALTTGLFANISLHALIAAIGLTLTARLTRRQMLPRAQLLTVLLFFLAAAATLAPAPDVDYPAGNNIYRESAKTLAKIGIHFTPPPPLTSIPFAGMQEAPIPVHIRHGLASTSNKLTRALAVLTYPVSTSRLLAFALLALITLQAIQANRAKGLIPYALVALAFASLYLAPRHAGTIFTTLLLAAWLTWPNPNQSHNHPRLHHLTTLAFAITAILQITWTLHALQSERKTPYAPDLQTATFLRQHQAGTPGVQVAAFYYGAASPLVYFPNNIFINLPHHRYWAWSTPTRSILTVSQVLAAHPQYIVVSGGERGPDQEITSDWQPISPPIPGVTLNDTFHIADFFLAHGYREQARFCGNSPMRTSYAETICDRILSPAPPAPAP